MNFIPEIFRRDLIRGSQGAGTSEKDWSQFGEQGYIEGVLGPKPADGGYAVEVGAADGIWLSPTYSLEKQGWNVLCFEPNPFYYPQLLTNRKLGMPYALSSLSAELVPFYVYDPGNGDFTAGSGFSNDVQHLQSVGMPKPVATYEFKVPVRTLDYCVAAAGFPRVDFLSIDAEGADMDVLRGFEMEVWKPKLVMIEAWEPSAEMDSYFAKKHYALAMRLHVNYLYVRTEGKDAPGHVSEPTAKR